ncbi:MAG: hypothetical protein IJ493_02290 [Clostridia bacterium]|nr:hypothetical protein [Clostridia bacterium]
MRLFHVSEDPNLSVFEPRIPTRADLDPEVPLVWALDEEHLPNFLTPRDCPRVAYQTGVNTTDEDAARFFTPPHRYTLVIESGWFPLFAQTTLWLYEFDPSGFIKQDDAAGYWVATTTQTPIGKLCVNDLFDELFRRNVELRVVENLWPIADSVQGSSLQWSLCRMRNACERQTL